MDQIWTFIQNLTWRDWVAIVGLIVLPLSALNAFFGLRTRYKDWQGIKSKANFEKRLGQLKGELVLIQTFRLNLPMFFLEVLTQAAPMIGLLFAAITLFMGGLTIYRMPWPGFWIFEYLYLLLGITGMIYVTAWWRRLQRLITIVNSPKDFGIELLDFIYTGRQKGFITGEEQYIRSVINNKIFSEDEKVQLFSRSFDLDRSSVNDHGTKPVHRDNGGVI